MDLRKILDAAVADMAKSEGKRVAAALYSLQVQNELLHHANEGLRAALTTKQKHEQRSNKLDLQQREEYHGGAVLWSPRVRETVKQREEEAENYKKSRIATSKLRLHSIK
jgi:hypothetical protein